MQTFDRNYNYKYNSFDVYHMKSNLNSKSEPFMRYQRFHEKAGRVAKSQFLENSVQK